MTFVNFMWLALLSPWLARLFASPSGSALHTKPSSPSPLRDRARHLPDVFDSLLSGAISSHPPFLPPIPPIPTPRSPPAPVSLSLSL